MTMIGGGIIGPTGGARVLTLSDTAGVDKLVVEDSDGFPVFSVDSLGNIRTKGEVRRI